MLLNCAIKSSGIGEFKLISADTWSECAAYLEGGSDEINSINLQNQTLIGVNLSSDESYSVVLKDTVTNLTDSYIIYDTYSNVISWINSQSPKILQTLLYQKRTFVQI